MNDDEKRAALGSARVAMRYAADATNIWVALHAQNIALAIRRSVQEATRT